MYNIKQSECWLRVPFEHQISWIIHRKVNIVEIYSGKITQKNWIMYQTYIYIFLIRIDFLFCFVLIVVVYKFSLIIGIICRQKNCSLIMYFTVISNNSVNRKNFFFVVEKSKLSLLIQLHIFSSPFFFWKIFFFWLVYTLSVFVVLSAKNAVVHHSLLYVLQNCYANRRIMQQILSTIQLAYKF